MRAFFVALLGLFTAISATNAQEAGPKVVSDIAPVGALVAMVLGDEEDNVDLNFMMTATV